jgi:hypothetical protein
MSLLDEFEKIQSVNTIVEEWYKTRESTMQLFTKLHEHGMSYAEAQILAMWLYSVTNPALTEAGLYWLAEVYDRLDEYDV